ncbi:hypothetical protein LTR56_021070 [Elasticomyces elasticus]|nr:hypothetical protein LTR56_021070 [Elasticomyces elasticus]KAK3635283.1 hypothetical protein LTR22_019279 [Elasticomyces elasticus]KAK4911653.1 hypothetical protein LTR49_019817 [Elasticomyces elasticus]KAK5748928.1 hypothetical protein LTS12_021033 [Elasticomyces elasticus]
MDKIKAIFKSDHGEHNEPTGSSSQGLPAGSSSTTGGAPAQLQTNPDVEKNDHGVLRQILNPGGDKHDEMRYGTTATSDKPLDIGTTGTKDIGGIGSSRIESQPDAEDSRGVARQVLNPGGDKHDDMRYGETGSTVPGTAGSRLGLQKERTASSMAIKSGVEGAFGGQADKSMAGSQSGATTGNERSFPLSGGTTAAADPTSRFGADEAAREDTSSASQSHLGRDAGLAGAGTAGVGALAYEADKSRQPEDTLPSSTYGESSLPTRGAESSLESSSTGAITGTGASGLGDNARHARDVPGDPFGYHKPDETPVEGYMHHTQGPHSTDIANVLDPHVRIDHNQPQRRKKEACSSAAKTAVPGEFPTETGEDRHASTLGRNAGIGGTALGTSGLGAAAGHEASQSRNDAYSGTASGAEHPITTTTNSRSPPTTGTSALPTEPEHHYGRDAAVAGGAGAAGLAGYEALKSHDSSAQRPDTGLGSSNAAPTTIAEPFDPATQPDHHQSQDPTLARGAGATGIGGYEALPDREQVSTASQMPSSAPVQGQNDISTQPEHHYGRDAAVAGGAGVLGVGGYEALKDRSDVRQQDPLSTSSQAQSSVPAHGQSDASTKPEHHYGRDAAVAGGAGAAGLAGYEALKDRSDVRQQDPLKTTSQAAPSALSAPPALAQSQRDVPTQPEHHYGRDAAVAGGAGTAGVAGYEALKHRDNTPQSTQPLDTTSQATQSTPAPAQSKPAAKPEHHHHLLHRHEKQAETPAAAPAQRDVPAQPDHHYGRDAAVFGGTGAAGVAGYEALENRNEPVSTDSRTGQHNNFVDPRMTDNQSPAVDETHYGRDAAIGGGALAAGGAGAYALYEDRNDTGPASKTLGPHDSNIANIVDPRVKPEPEKMKGKTADEEIHHRTKVPVVEPAAPKKAIETEQPKSETHYGRDAAVVGGTGAAAAGAYEATRPSQEVRPTREELVHSIQQHENDGHLHKTPAQIEKHEHELQKAREKEAAKGGDHGEKKESFLHKILHPGHKDKHEDETPKQVRHQPERSAAGAAGGLTSNPPGTSSSGAGQERLGGEESLGEEGIVKHPITGLPMNVGKYGDGHGGTDATPQIPGVNEHEASPAAAADWKDVHKKNTLY